jgi:tetratricopeptide (TPR) repeat protein
MRLSMSSVKQKTYDVFLSHSHADAGWVEKLARKLEDKEKLRVWLDRWILVPGKPFIQEMEMGLENAGSCVVCIGERTPQGWFRKEIDRALNRQVKEPDFRVIPLLLPEAQDANVDDFIELNTWVDLRNGLDDESGFHRLVCGIKGIEPGRGPVTARDLEDAHQRSSPIRMAILQSAPLVYFDKNNRAHAVDALDFETEQDNLFKCFQETGRAIEIRIEAATAENLQKLVILGYRALHYSGHGHPDFLAFEDGRGAMQAMKPDIIKQLIAPCAHDIELVFVSACHSQKAAQAFAEAGIPHVVGVRLETPVYDIAASTFSRAFYLAVSAGRTIRQAYESGKAAVKALPGKLSGDEKNFILLPEEGNHDAAIFAGIPAGEFRDVSEKSGEGLPAMPEKFTGRNVDMQEILGLIIDNRFVTIHGTPGIGKTALAKAVSHYISERGLFQDGIFFVNLRNAISAEAVRSAISLKILGAPAKDDKQLFDALISCRCLIILDNCEDPLHFARNEFRTFLSQFIQEDKYAKLLLTSREAAGAIPGAAEKIIPLQRLLPPDDAILFNKLSPRKIKFSEVGINDPDPFIEKLAEHPVLKFLSGHPQAIALAAALLDIKSMQQLNELLQKKKDEALKTGEISDDERDPTNSFTVSLGVSAGYLRERNPEALRLFGLMGLLPSGAFPADLDAICEGIWENGWQPLMDSLVRRSLVERRISGEMEHFSTFPFITSYALRLLAEDDRILFSGCVCEYFSNMSENISEMMGTQNASRAFSLFEFEEGNILECLRRPAIVKKKDEDMSPTARISSSLLNILLFAYRADDGIFAGNMGLKACRSLNERKGEANTLQALGDLKVRVDDLAGARRDYETALPIYREIQERLGEANTLQALGDLKVRVSDLAGARRDYETALPIYREIQERLGEANTLQALGDLKVRVSDLAGARRDYETALPIYREIQERLGEANTLKALGDLKVRVSDLAGARRDYETALPIYREIQARLGEANTLQGLGNLLTAEGEFEEAFLDFQDALKIHIQVKNLLGVGAVLGYSGRAKIRAGQYNQAVLLFDMALSIHSAIDDKYGKALDLMSQADAFQALEIYEGMLAAKWQARQIFRDIQSPAAEQLDELFSQIEKNMGKENFRKATADLNEHADERRHEALLAVQKDAMEDAFLHEVTKAVSLIRDIQ